MRSDGRPRKPFIELFELAMRRGWRLGVTFRGLRAIGLSLSNRRGDGWAGEMVDNDASGVADGLLARAGSLG